MKKLLLLTIVLVLCSSCTRGPLGPYGPLKFVYSDEYKAKVDRYWDDQEADVSDATKLANSRATAKDTYTRLKHKLIDKNEDELLKLLLANGTEIKSCATKQIFMEYDYVVYLKDRERNLRLFQIISECGNKVMAGSVERKKENVSALNHGI